MPNRFHGLRALLHDTVHAVIELVEETHESAARKPIDILGIVPGIGDGARAVGSVQHAIAKAAYGGARLINRGIECAGDAAALAADRTGVSSAVGRSLALPIDPRAAKELAVWTDTAQSALNAWVGDFLAKRDNRLAIPFGFFSDGKPLACERAAFAAAFPEATPKVCIFMHGLGCTDASWRYRAREHFGDEHANYGTLLEQQLGYTPLYVRYNTGLHVSENAHELARQLDLLLDVYPGAIEEIALVGHSMGGLVARGAAHYAQLEQRAWLDHLTHILCIGSPNLGAPLEKATHALSALLSRFDTPGTQVPAKLLNVRSSGIKDLRFGYVLDEDWMGKDPDAFLRPGRNDVSMVPSVTYGSIAATFLRDPEHPLGHLLGDLLVRVPSARGHAPEPDRHVRFDLGELVHGVHHIAMLNHPLVYAQVRRFLSPRVLEAQAES